MKKILKKIAVLLVLMLAINTLGIIEPNALAAS